MRDFNNVGREQMEEAGRNELGKENGIALNFDIRSYRFHDLDLAMAASELSRRDQDILALHLMGHTQNAIATNFTLSRSLISKRLTAITRYLREQLTQTP